MVAKILRLPINVRPTLRVAVRGAFPRDALALLVALNIDPFAVGASDADLMISGERVAEGWYLEGRPEAGTLRNRLLCENPFVVASAAYSWLNGLQEPVLAPTRSAFARLSNAIASAAHRGNLLIQGETGSGKSLIARLLNGPSDSGELPMRVDCATAVEVEQFLNWLAGPRADLGGGVQRPVLFERIDELSASHQRALAETLRARRGRVRIIATAKQLRWPTPGGAHPLAARFNQMLTLAPLSERREEIPLLARHFLRQTNPELSLDNEALALLLRCAYPGNLRELRNLMTCAELYQRNAPTRIISAAHLRMHIGQPERDSRVGRAKPRSPRRLALAPTPSDREQG